MFVMTPKVSLGGVKPAFIFQSDRLVATMLRAVVEWGHTDIVIHELGDSTGFSLVAEIGDSGEYEQDLT